MPELNNLKQLKIQAYRAWVEPGRPREDNNPLYTANKVAKKNFSKRIKQISKQYEEEKFKMAVSSAEVDHTTFWKLLKMERDGPCAKTPSIKDPTGKVVHEVKEWKDHFASP